MAFSSEMPTTPSVDGHATRSVRVRGRHIEGHLMSPVGTKLQLEAKTNETVFGMNRTLARVIGSQWPDAFAGPSAGQKTSRGATARAAASRLDQKARSTPAA